MDKETLGGWSVDEAVIEFIKDNLKPGATILELGSGYGSKVLVSEGFKVYSVEHNKDYVYKYEGVNYIYAPLVGGWYDLKALELELPFEYDLILVDGPPGIRPDSRHGFAKNLHLFNTDGFILFDDINREGDKKGFELTQNELSNKRIKSVINEGRTGVIYPKT